MTVDVLILGAGPAGLAAAGALGRTLRRVLILAEDEHPNRGSHPLHGVLACEGMNRVDFITQSQQQITSAYQNVRLESDIAKSVTAIGTPGKPAFEVRTASGVVHQTRRLILATGAVHELPTEIYGFTSCWPDHIYQCLLCDGFERANGPHGVGVLAWPLSEHHVHLALRARCFNTRVVVYTNGCDTDEQQREAEKLFAPLLSQFVTLQQARISRLEPLPVPEGPGVRLHLDSGNTECADFLVYKTLTRPGSADLATQLGLPTAEVPGHGTFITREEPTGSTNVPGVYVCGDAGSPIKGVAPAMAQGVCAADVIWGGLVEEDRYKYLYFFTNLSMDIGIIGAGVIGLSIALVLSEAGYHVTVVARELPGDSSLLWASPWAGAGILPYPTNHGRDLQAATYRYFWSLAQTDPSSGVQRTPVREYFDDRGNDDSEIWYQSLVVDYHRLPGHLLGFTYLSTTVNPDLYLPWLQGQAVTHGVRFIRQTVDSISMARSVSGARVIINASGLGALQLAPDPAVAAVRGHVLLLKSKDAAVAAQEMILFQGSQYTYCIPRMGTGGVILGGVSQPGDMRRTADPDARNDIIARVQGLAPDIVRSIDPGGVEIEDIVAFRPGREGGYRLDCDGRTIHAYGFGGLGYTYSYGVALKVRGIVNRLREEEVDGY
ncbi:pyridine nucleotide-disulfide oxidoreductase class-II [Fusarium subglutinans]|uniref:Pyridine nucleotide-disulfide oxidoreductase class-II n=1 Tax=Gibberella subglutinans TaxID=42677 RepID=A0A8H5NV80_GIBSU|nr:pyridine nucleotide-disulfide oxidoreductase class-II [Fusarium subglutinans]KAF5580566.1 pyridine nucleotide-disulfide oxidoreductase class-II [Fusarium subglutinans]